MFKLITLGALLFSSLALQFHPNHLATEWKDASKLVDTDKSFDDFFRKSIPALGDSVAKEIAHVGDQTWIKYKDNTNANN